MKKVITSARQVQLELKKKSSDKYATTAQRFFKTGPGEYGEGDIFIGVRVPDIREIARKFSDLPISELQKLVSSKIHEERMLGFIVCVTQVTQARRRRDHRIEERLVKFYLKNRRHLNNWDLIDVTTPKILGPYFFSRSRRPLEGWVRSKSLWDRRIAIMTTQEFIRHNDFGMTLKLCEFVLNDKEDLIHKASGWMLREIGKKDVSVLRDFIARLGKRMPRTMLRYAIEKFSKSERQKILRQTSAQVA